MSIIIPTTINSFISKVEISLVAIALKERITTITTTIKRSCCNSAQIYQIQNSRMIRKLIVFFSFNVFHQDATIY